MAQPSSGKAEGALRTIGELSRDTGLPQHVLRYWESRFPQLRPLTRAGGRRYYRPEDVALVRRIDTWLNHEGYTVRGVQQLLAGTRVPASDVAAPVPIAPAVASPALPPAAMAGGLTDALRAIRESLVTALRDDERLGTNGRARAS